MVNDDRGIVLWGLGTSLALLIGVIGCVVKMVLDARDYKIHKEQRFK